jgi:hypothetical protein
MNCSKFHNLLDVLKKNVFWIYILTKRVKLNQLKDLF